MTTDYLRVAYEYLQMIGGLCAFCVHARRVLTDGNVDCEKYQLTRGVLRCKDFESRGKEEFYQALRYGTTD
jgi:hypothetical protein